VGGTLILRVPYMSSSSRTTEQVVEGGADPVDGAAGRRTKPDRLVNAQPSRMQVDGGPAQCTTLQALSHEEFARIQPHWDEVASRSPAGGPLISHAWLSTTFRAAGPEGPELLAYLVKRGSQPVAIGAFVRDGGFCRTLRFAGGIPANDAYGLAYLPGEESAGLGILRAVIEGNSADRVVLMGVPPQLADCARELPLTDVALERDAKILVEFQSEDWRDYQQGCLGAKFRRELKREERRLGEVGRVTLRREKDPRLVMAALGRLHIIRSAQRGRRSVFGQPVSFINAHVRQAARDGYLASYQLLLDDQPVAALLAFEKDARAWMTHIAFDPTYHTYGPGMLLIHRMLEDQLDHGLRIFDFGMGDGAFKRRFGNRREPWCAISGLSAPSLATRARAAAAGLVGRIREVGGPVGRPLLLRMAGGVSGQLSFLEAELEDATDREHAT
jgi:CelD/BcsL family acetyltransferase involved in cellulose biosynthesis